MTEDKQNLDKKRSDRNKKNTKKKGKRKYFRIALVVLLLLIFIGGGVGAGVAYSYIKDVDPLDMDKFIYMEPSVILDVNGDFYQELQGKEKRDMVSIDQIPDVVKKAFISIEDERFETHKGVDILGIAQAAFQGLKAGDLTTAGGSTITQQLIKLTHLNPEKTLKRKVQEAYLAIQLERNMTKDQILEAYLNKINFAYAHGIQAAAQTYFRKNVDELSVAQAAVLAAIPKSPTAYKPYIIEEKEDGSFGLAYKDDGKTLVYSSKNQSRALLVIGKLKELGHINETEYTEAKEQIENEDIGLVEPQDPPVYSYFTDAVYDQVVEDLMEEYNYDKEQATTFLLNSGLKIHATIDPNIQSIMDENFKNNSLFPSQTSAAKQASQAKSKETGESINYTPEGAMVVIDNRTGYVAGITGGRQKEGSRSLNRALQPFQPGSSTKPLTVYAPGINEKKITLATTYDDVPIKIGSYKPGNAGGGSSGMTTIRHGLFKSLNIIAVQAWYDVGLENSIKYGEKFGLEFAEQDTGPASFALGGYTYGQTPLAMASAFSTFPNEGVRTEPTFYTKVEDRKGNVILEHKSEKTQVITPQTAFLVTDVLKDVPRGGTTSISVPRMEIAGKTGTTNDNMHAWFVGYTPYYTASVWYGYDENKVVANGKTYRLNIGIYGGSRPGPASMWQSVMRDIHKDLSSKKLPGNPGGIVSAQVDSVSGLLPTELTAKDPRGSTVISEMFISGTVPTEKDNYHVEMEVDITTNKIPSEYCPPELIQTKVFIKKPEDRFPGPVKPIDPDYVPKGEEGVLAPSEDDICDVHGPNSLNELQIVAPKTTIEVGEEIQLSINGSSYSSSSIDVDNVEYSSDSAAVLILDKRKGLIKGQQEGSAKITAMVSFKYKTMEDGEEVEKEYTRSTSININVVETQQQEINLNISKETTENNIRLVITPSLDNYSGTFDVSLSPQNMNVDTTTFGIPAGESAVINLELTGPNASLGITIKANGLSKSWNVKEFEYVESD